MITYIVVGMYITLFSIPCGVFCYYVKKTKIMPSGCPISYKEVLSNKHKTNYLLQTRRIQSTPQIMLNPIDEDSETSDEDSYEDSDEDSDEDSYEDSDEDSVTSDKENQLQTCPSFLFESNR